MAIQLRSAAELDKMYRAGQVVYEVLNALRPQVKPGMTTMDLEHLAEEIIAKRPGKAAFKGYRGYPCVLCTSVNSEIVHGIPSPKRKVREGDIVSIDFGMEVDGYYGDSAVTVPVGHITPQIQKLLDVTLESLDRAIDKMRSGNRRFFTGFIRDLTERQKTEARLQELQSELVHISRLTAMGEMASTLAHELNQPLSAISNYLKGSRRMLEGAGDEQSATLRGALEKASEQAMRAGQIIRRLRDFVSRGETERRVESIKKLVEEASALALVGVKDRGIRVQFQFDPAVDLVLADRVQIQQVVLNLIRNAMDAMETSDKRDLVLIVASEGETHARISVTDTGSGISPDIADQLFTPFLTTKRQGMGVGLSISRTIVEAHGGRIWVEANPGGGTIFHFTLMVVNVEDVDA